LSAQAPAHLTDDINLVASSGRRLLRSAVDRTCVVPRTHNTYGDKSFTAAGPRLWNSLPSNLRLDISYGLFSLLFSEWRKLIHFAFFVGMGGLENSSITHSSIPPGIGVTLGGTGGPDPPIFGEGDGPPTFCRKRTNSLTFCDHLVPKYYKSKTRCLLEVYSESMQDCCVVSSSQNVYKLTTEQSVFARRCHGTAATALISI